MNQHNDIYGKYSLIPLLTTLKELDTASTSCLECIDYYQEAINYGELSYEEEKERMEEEVQIIKRIRVEIEDYLIPLSN